MTCFWDASIRLDLLLSETIEEFQTVDRLTEKLNKVAGLANRVTSKLEERCDLMIEREGAIEQRTNRLFEAKHAILDDAERGLDAIEKHLAILSNDPLGGSGNGSDPSPETHTRDSNGNIIER